MRAVLQYLAVIACLLTSQMTLGQGTVSGSVKDSISGDNMLYVAVALYKSGDSSLVTGVISQENGQFELSKIAYGSYYLKLSFMGYQDRLVSPVNVTKANPKLHLPAVRLSPQMELLDAVEISTDRAVVTYEIDKKVVNVEEMNTTASGTAVDVLENIPSVTVDSDGNVSLRGSSGFTLLIDGMPSNMSASDALAVIPATNIKDIEIITNPSAKYDAEGTAGIINVILKKNKLDGVSTLINANVGNFNNYGGDFLTSINKGKFKVNLGGYYRNSNRYRDIYQIRRTILDEGESEIISNGLHRFFRTPYGLNTAFEYAPNDHNTFSLAANGDQRQYNAAADYDFQEFLNGTLINEYQNDERTLRQFYAGMVSGGWKRTFDHKDHFLHLTSMLNYNYGQEDALTEFLDANDNYLGGNQAFEVGPSRLWRINLDYQKPLGKDLLLQVGARADMANNSDDQDSYQYDTTTADFEYLPDFSTDVNYLQDVWAGYGIVGGKLKEKLGYQFGIRGEYTDRLVTITTGDGETVVNRMDWFPSAHFSYEHSDTTQFKASFSRRINRPRSWYLEPFATWEDPFTLRQGNPELLPEYILAYELGWIQLLGQGSFSAELYFRTTSNVIQRIQEVYNDTNAIIKRPVNAGASQAGGLELSYQQRLTPWWKINFGTNLFYYKIEGSISSGELNQEQFTFNGRLSQDFEISKTLKVQLISNYQSNQVTAQGGSTGFFRSDLAIKKDWLDRKITTTFQWNNFLKTQFQERWVETSTLYSYRLAEPAWPVISLAMAVRLNNYNHQHKIKTVDGDSF